MVAGFYIDHDVTPVVALELRRHGYSADAARDLGLQAAHDADQLATAAQRGQVLVSHNWRDFRILHQAWCAWPALWGLKRNHAGILIVPDDRWTPGQMADELHAFASSHPDLTDTMHRWRAGRGWVPFTPYPTPAARTP